MEEFNAMAFIKSSFPTMSIRKDCPARDVEGVHCASRAAEMKYADENPVTERWPGQNRRQKHGRGLRRNNEAMPVDAVGCGAANRRQQENRDLAGESDCSPEETTTL